MRDWASSVTHMVGGGVALLFGVWLLWRTLESADWLTILSVSLFVFVIVCLFVMSALFHAFRHGGKPRAVFERLDYAFIYATIAATYTATIGLYVRSAWWLLIVLWVLAASGIALAGMGYRGKKVRTVVCLAMGWSILFVWDSVVTSLSGVQLFLLITGGIAYTVGSLFFVFDSIKWPSVKFGFHEIWHVFVTLGALSHIVMLGI